MARARNIKPGFFLNDLLAEIDPLGRLLFAGLWTIADREGRLEDRPRKIKATVLPYDDCDVDHLLDELEKRDFIIRYEIGEDRYIQITKWNKHQSPHMKEPPSEIPAPDKYQTSLVQEPDKPDYSPPDSLNLIPDSFNPHITISEDESSNPESSSREDQNFDIVVKNLYHKLKDLGIKKSNSWYKEQIGIAKNLLLKYPVDEICSVINWAFTDKFYRKAFNSLAMFENALQAMKGGADNGRTRTSQQPDRRPLTAEDYDEPEYRDLIRASDRKLEKLGNLPEVPPDD